MNTRMLAWPSYTVSAASGPQRPTRRSSGPSLLPFGMEIRGPLPRSSSLSYDTALLQARKVAGGRVLVFLQASSLQEPTSGFPDEEAEQTELLPESTSFSWFLRWTSARKAYRQASTFGTPTFVSLSFCA